MWKEVLVVANLAFIQFW